MKRIALVLTLLLPGLLAATPLAVKPKVGLSGDYLEARTCDVWVGACFANAEMNLTGKHATLAWRINQGAYAGQTLDGLAVVAVVEAANTFGLEQRGPAKAVLIIDANATSAQAQALKKLAQELGGELTRNLVAERRAKIAFQRQCCAEEGCAKLTVAGLGGVETRCIHPEEDSVCGHEDNFYPPLTKVTSAKSAMIIAHRYEGPGLGMTWDDASRRGAYLGTFTAAD
jgi:hypothetical protein